MAKKIKDQENPEVKEEKVTEATENAAEETKETEAPAEEAKEEKKDDKVTALEKELADEKDRFLRLAAEYDNFRKRTQKEKDRMYSVV